MAAMQALIEMVIGLIALLAAVALSQFGVDLSPTKKSDGEIHRVEKKCGDAPSTHIQVHAPASC
ncbi:hypothetical protein ACLBV5_02610 [Brevundimonas sp. M1A4_2e]|jgi:hypothetical protein